MGMDVEIAERELSGLHVRKENGVDVGRCGWWVLMDGEDLSRGEAVMSVSERLVLLSLGVKGWIFCPVISLPCGWVCLPSHEFSKYII